MVGSLGIYEALKKLFVTDKDGHIIVDSMPAVTANADVTDRAARLLGKIYGDQGVLTQRATSLDLYVQLRNAGVEIDPTAIRALTASDVVTVASLSKFGGTALTGRDISLDLKTLSDATVAGTLRTLNDIGADVVNTLRNATGFVTVGSTSLNSAVFQAYALSNPAGSGKTALVVKHTLFSVAAPSDSGLLTNITEAEPATADLEVFQRTMGSGVTPVCRFRKKAATGLPTGATSFADVISIAVANTKDVASVVFVIPAGKSLWVANRQQSGNNAQNVISYLTWVEF